MRRTKASRNMLVATLTLATLLLLCGTAVAQSTQVQGIIDGRKGATMTVKSADSSNVVVLLTDISKVRPSGKPTARVESRCKA